MSQNTSVPRTKCPHCGREPIEEVSDVPEKVGPPLERAEAGASVRPCGGLQSGPSQEMPPRVVQ